MKEKVKKAKTSNRGVVAENPVADDFENINLSKADFVKKQKAKLEKEAKIKEFSKKLDGKKEKLEEVKKDTVEEPKKGRPKKMV